MKSYVRSMLLACWGALSLASSALAQTTTTTYQYDALGRLRQASTNGALTGAQTYTYDAAGNRTQTTSNAAPTVPASINVPSTSATGVYTVQWGGSNGNVTAYELYEATNASFSGQVNVYGGGVATSKQFSNKPTGTFYYRVRACNTSVDCSGYKTATGPIVVTVTPSQPPSISVPNTSTNTTGSYSISWAASTLGIVKTYEIQEATNAGFTTQVIVYSVNAPTVSKAISGKNDGAFYYRVRACNTSVDCSAYQTSGTPVTVRIKPGTPSSITVLPATNTTGGYPVQWGAASGTVTAYQLYEATNSSFTGEQLVVSSTLFSYGISGKINGTYYYRVRACNTVNSCSGYAPGPNVVTVTLPSGPTAPLNLRKSPSTGTGNIYTILWDPPAQGTASYYILEESISGVAGPFTPFPQINAPTTSKNFNYSCGEYTYRAKACPASGTCSGYSNTTTKRVCNN